MISASPLRSSAPSCSAAANSGLRELLLNQAPPPTKPSPILVLPNRLNVAISRAQCLSIVVGSPALSTGISRSVAEVHQLSRLCRLMEIGS